MTKRRLLLIAFLPLIAAVALGVLSILPSRHGVTKANFDRIEKGMPKAEVEALFGEKDKPWDGAGQKGWPVCWTAKDGSEAVVEFVDECVIEKRWHDSEETIIQRIRRWLRFR